MNRPSLPVIVVLGVAVLGAGVNAFGRQDPEPRASVSREVDDQRNVVAKPEVRDAVEEEVGQREEAGTTTGPALVDVVPAAGVEPWFFFAAPEYRLDAGRLPGRACFIRGPPRLS